MQVDDATIDVLGTQLADQSIPLAKRFRILFTLRNLVSDRSVKALSQGMKNVWGFVLMSG